jgi:DNA-binding XRE family transcriptional regulator
MNLLETMAENLRRKVRGAKVTIDPPQNPLATWHLDATHGGAAVVVDWRPSHGFGISASEEKDSGSGDSAPDEIYEDADEAQARVLHLLRTGEKTYPSREIDLRRVRAACKASQEDVAERLGISQASVSRLEQRGDLRLSTLRRYVQALGAELEVRARVGGRSVPILAAEKNDPQPARASASRTARRRRA